MNQEPLLRWWAYEYPIKKRDLNSFASLGIVALGTLGAAILFKNFLFAVLIILGVAILLLFAFRRPAIVAFEINELGVLVDKKLYPYKELESFFVIDENASPKLLLHSKRTFAPLLTIPLENVEPRHVHELLQTKIREKELHEPLTQRLIEYLGW